MAQGVKWGIPEIWASKLDAAGNPTTWFKFPNPKKGTTRLVPTKGETKEALAEGGELVDKVSRKNTHVFSCHIFDIDNPKPIEDNDGPIDGYYALRIIPENGGKGYFLPKTKGHLLDDFNPDVEGTLWQYEFDVLKPETGKSVQTFESALGITPVSLSFTTAADATGKKFTVANGTGTVTATVQSGATWATATVTAAEVTVTVTANTGVARSATVTIVRSALTQIVHVTQAGV